MTAHPPRAHAIELGRTHRSPKPKLRLRDFVDVEKAQAHLTALAVQEERVVDLSTIVRLWPMFANNSLGDCTCAGAAHGEQVFAALAGVPFTVTLADVLRMYEASGWQPGNSSSDQGWTLQAAAGYLRTVGFQRKPSILAYADVALDDDDAQQVAMGLFGGLYEGASLPLSAQAKYRAGHEWTVTNHGDDAGSWGGHCMWRVKSTLRRTALHVTWGGLQVSSHGWDRAYVDELLAFIPTDWETRMPERLVAAGVVDLARLRSLLEQVAGTA